MMKPLNQVQISFPSNSVNEGFARAAVSAFLAQLDPTVADLTDLKTGLALWENNVEIAKQGTHSIFE